SPRRRISDPATMHGHGDAVPEHWASAFCIDSLCTPERSSFYTVALNSFSLTGSCRYPGGTATGTSAVSSDDAPICPVLLRQAP
ncbi:MAG: hypothetical protein J6P67_02230, partial [Bacteroidaceae bacterium]|nr:hypothetical protein [Bacteroidaceae bacterium]